MKKIFIEIDPYGRGREKIQCEEVAFCYAGGSVVRRWLDIIERGRVVDSIPLADCRYLLLEEKNV